MLNKGRLENGFLGENEIQLGSVVEMFFFFSGIPFD